MLVLIQPDVSGTLVGCQAGRWLGEASLAPSELRHFPKATQGCALGFILAPLQGSQIRAAYRNAAPGVLGSVRMVISPAVMPGALPSSRIEPGVLDDRTTTSARPLNNARWLP